MKIIIPGGHLTPALAFIDYVKAHHPDDELVFCGRLYSQDRLKQKSQEKNEVSKRDIPFVVFSAPRWDHASLVAKMLYPFLLIGAFFQAATILWREKPSVILSFGGYLAIPLVMAAVLLGIPVVTHEQTRTIGLANTFIARLAKKIALSYPESAAGLPLTKVVVTGNPLRLALFSSQPRPSWLSTKSEKPIVYITGGNQGSEIINVTVQQSLKVLTKDWLIIHQCGNPTQNRHYRQELEQARLRLPVSLQPNYVAREWLSEEEVGWVYQHATAVVSRAGANTVLELAAHRLPSILIPLPFAHGDEQTINARYLADKGGAIVLTQKELNSDSLPASLAQLFKFRRSMKTKLNELVVQSDAPAKLYQVVSSVL